MQAQVDEMEKAKNEAENKLEVCEAEMQEKIKNLEGIVQAAFNEYQKELDTVNAKLKDRYDGTRITAQDLEAQLKEQNNVLEKARKEIKRMAKFERYYRKQCDKKYRNAGTQTTGKRKKTPEQLVTKENRVLQSFDARISNQDSRNMSPGLKTLWAKQVQ